MHPVGEIQFMDFVTLSMEQLALQAAKLRFMFGGKASVPMVLRMPAGSGTGAAAQHSESLENLLVHIPGLKVVMPSNAYDAKGLLLSAIYDGNPVIFIEHKLLYKTAGHVKRCTALLSSQIILPPGGVIAVVATSSWCGVLLKQPGTEQGRHRNRVADPPTSILDDANYWMCQDRTRPGRTRGGWHRRLRG
jgi:pyruvate dehydrogenase E1 component beta subunit